jgi:N4-gp56 family major capsid protein
MTKPTARVLSTYNVTSTLTQYGDHVGVSDLVEMTAISSVITEAIQVMSEQSALTMDAYIRKIAFGNTMNIDPIASSLSAEVAGRYTGSISALSALQDKVLGFTTKLVGSLSAYAGTSGDALSGSGNWTASAWEHKLTLHDIRRAVTVLRSRNVKPLDGTYYLGIIAPGALEHIMDDTSTGGWIDWQKYTNPETMYKGEVGRAEGVRFVSTTEAFDYPTGNADLSVTILTIVGKGALGVVDFQSVQDVQHSKNESSIIIKRANKYNTSDPLNQVAATVGWKWTIAAAVLNTSCGLHVVATRKA